MLKPRVIPILLIKNRDLVKSLQFDDHLYVGDPINTIRLFNEKKCDEILIYDISGQEHEIDYDFIKIIASESRMPVCYGGNVKKINEIEKILSIGIEKISLNTVIFKDPDLVKTASAIFGKQSIVVTIDVKKKNNEYFVYNKNEGIKNINLKDHIKNLQDYAGELIIQSVDNDGKMIGYDLNLFDKINNQIKIPFTFAGGAGNINHINQIIEKNSISACACGSLFVFKKKRGVVLINYLNHEEKIKINEAFNFTKNNI